MTPLAARLLTSLARGPASATTLTTQLRTSQPTLSRALRRLQQQDEVLALRSGRQVTYAARRTVRSIGSRWPLFRVTHEGSIQRLGELAALQPRHYQLSGPVAVAGLTDALPYLLQDLRPAGFLGRLVPKRYPGLVAPPRIGDWNDEHMLEYLVRYGADLPGDLILGDEALELSLALRSDEQTIDRESRAGAYPRLAEAALRGDGGHSSAQGEQPKFTVRIGGPQPQSLIVKFSPPTNDAPGRRWSDLLIAEHLALQTLSEGGIWAAHSAVLESAGRCFLEVVRFDRPGTHGRRGIASLLAVDAARYGELDRWSRAAARLCRDGALPPEALDNARRIEAFAMQIANSDRHFGNLSLWDAYTGSFELAPVYDMLPMAYAPRSDGRLPDYSPLPLPTAETAEVWQATGLLARRYWERVANDARISTDFRTIADRHAAE